MAKILKYPISSLFEGRDIVSIQLPRDARPVHVDFQHGSLYLWAIVDTDVEEIKYRNFLIIGTGIDLPTDKRWSYMTSLLTKGYVWHIFIQRKD